MHLWMREERRSTARMHERHQCLNNLDERAQLLKMATKKTAKLKTRKIKTLSTNKLMMISSRRMTQLSRIPQLQSMELT